MRAVIKGAMAAVLVAGSSLAVTAPAQARDHTGVAIAAGIIGLGIGAAIASDHSDRSERYDRYDHSYNYGYGYDTPGYHTPGYSSGYGYNDGNNYGRPYYSDRRYRERYGHERRWRDDDRRYYERRW